MKKKIFLPLCSILLTLVFLMMTCTAAVMGVSATTDRSTVSFKSPAIPTDTGTTVDLSKYNVEFSTSNIVNAENISWSSDDITVTSGKVTPTSKGVYELTATNGTYRKSIYLVVKAPSEKEYVLYEDDFSTNTLSNYSLSGNCSVADGKLVLNSKSGTDAYITLPNWLQNFGNYSITSDVKITEANNEQRWISIMYRINGVKYPFFQMAVRQNAALSNGVELANNMSGTWGYHFKGSYTSALSPTSFYTLGLDVYENRAAVSINGTLCGESEAITQIECGNVGLRSNGCIAYFDNIKVTARFDTKGMSADTVDVREIESGIILPPSMIFEIKNRSGLEGILTNSPAVAMMTLDSNGNLLSADGSVICPVSDAIDILDGRVIPAIRPAADCDTDRLSYIISSLRLRDVMFVSDDPDQIKAIRAAQNTVVGVYDLTSKDIDPYYLETMDVLTTGAKICILPAGVASQKRTDFLNVRGITVWYQAEADTKTELFGLVSAGANGILTNDRKLLEQVISSPIFKDNSIIRPVSVIGHRGTPALAPENTVEGSLLAAANGANIIENDIYITTDNVIVVMHDSTIDRTTNGTGNVESFSYAELCRYYVDCAPTTDEDEYGRITEAQPIPKLEDYFIAFDGTNTFMFIEIKSSQHEKLATELKKLIDKYDIADQCGVISFSRDALEAIRAAIPQISVGYLCSDASLDVIVNNTTRLESSYNPDQSKVTPELVAELAARGIFTWPWTIRDTTKFDKFFLMGVAGITTDNSYFAKDYVKRAFMPVSNFEFKVGEALDNVYLSIQKYGDTKLDRTNDAELIILEGNQSITYSDGKLSATAAGEASALFRYSFRLNNGQTAFVYSEPVFISVTGDSASNGNDNNNNNVNSDSPSDTTSTKPNTTTQKADENDGGCGSSLSTLTVAVMTLGLGAIFFKKRD